MKSTVLERGNIHLSYGQRIRPHDQTIAGLVVEFSSKKNSMLDIGCGVGHLVSTVQSQLPELKISIADIDKKMLSIAGDKINAVERIGIRDASDLAELGIKYDIVTMSHVLEHTLRPADIVKGLMQHVVAENGILILAVPNMGRFEVSLLAMRRKHYVNKGHVYAWDRSHWRNFLENILELNVLKYEADYFPLPVVKNWPVYQPVSRVLIKIFPHMAHSNIAVIRSGSQN